MGPGKTGGAGSPLIAYEEIFFWVGNIWGFTSCALLAAAWVLIVFESERFQAVHQWLMIFMTAGGWAFVLFYLSGRLFASSGTPVPSWAIPWIAVHGTVSLLTLSGATLLAWARLTEKPGGGGLRSHLNLHHTWYGRVIAALWLLSHAGGILNLYILK